MTLPQDDIVDFLEEEDAACDPAPVLAPWQVLIVDDDHDIHEATQLVLSDVDILGRRLQFHDAYSAAEALRMLRELPDVALVLLDVVMESPDSGLQLIHAIRTDLGLRDVRIVLRTGQPGYAPEIEAIRHYDINDYKTKSELTRTRLYTTVTAALRTYDQLTRTARAQRGLRDILDRGQEVLATRDWQRASAIILEACRHLSGDARDALLCAPLQLSQPEYGQPSPSAQSWTVLAASGRWSHFPAGSPLPIFELPASWQSLLDDQMAAQAVTDLRPGLCLQAAGRESLRLVAFLEHGPVPDDTTRQLLEVLVCQMATAAENLHLLARLHQTAYHDPLLQIPNRAYFVEAIDQRLAEGKTAGYSVALLDLDQFAETNETFGSAYGDHLLQAIAQRLQQAMGQECLLARVSGDVFGLMGRTEVLRPEALTAIFESPFRIHGDVEHTTTMCVGLYRLDEEDSVPHSGSDVVKNSGMAVKRAKSMGQAQHSWYTAAFGHEVRARTRMLHALRRAVAEDALFLAYQPQINLQTGEVFALEALMRWRGTHQQFVPPDQFIPIAEQSGMITGMGAWALSSALYRLRQLHEQGYDQLSMAVNVSAIQFMARDFVTDVMKALDLSGVAPHHLELEITESVAMQDPAHIQAMMQRLKALGVRVAIDDFGTGFSSLSYLDKLPADRLKIDRSFIRHHSPDSDQHRIAPMIIGLAHSLGMRVIAEGVEDETQAEWLAQLGCHEAQGYYFGRPMSGDELDAWLRVHYPRHPDCPDPL